MPNYTCSTCERTFNKRASLRNHIKTHDNTDIDRILREVTDEVEEANVRKLVGLSDNEPIKMVLSYDESNKVEELSSSIQQLEEVVAEEDIIIEENEEIVEEGEEEEEMIEEEEEEIIEEEETNDVSDHMLNSSLFNVYIWKVVLKCLFNHLYR
jgi:hypothetical protein